jgi:ribosome assembly protein RRB1
MGDDEEDGHNKADAKVQSWNPLTSSLAPGTKLEVDETAYKMHHSLTPEWPSLSFDFLRDNLGESRTRFPHSMIVAAGTQADRVDRNKLTIMKLSDLCRTSAKNEDELEDEILGEEYNKDDDSDDDDEDSDEDSDEDEVEDRDPVLEHFNLNHNGGVNRVRAMPQRSEIIATWSDVGTVNLYDVGGVLDSFDRSSGTEVKNQRKINKNPFFVYQGHSTEGYAMDWSKVNEGHLVTGDCDGNIHLWCPTEGGLSKYSTSSFKVTSAYGPNGGNIDHPSVEDLQWSPTEGTVFASAECGGYVKIFDTRCSGRPMLTTKIHENGSDVNVISWNPIISNLLASGGDDGKCH